MKTIITLFIVFISITSLGQNISTNSQNEVSYRLVAYKNTDNTITSVSNIVTVAKKLNLQVPNAFSPDGDGINDHFSVVHDGVEEFAMDIYSRWGELVYHTEDVEQPWKGDCKGSDCKQDAYVYVITARGLEDASSTTLKGTVSLIR